MNEPTNPPAPPPDAHAAVLLRCRHAAVVCGVVFGAVLLGAGVLSAVAATITTSVWAGPLAFSGFAVPALGLILGARALERGRRWGAWLTMILALLTGLMVSEFGGLARILGIGFALVYCALVIGAWSTLGTRRPQEPGTGA
ncbi:MAG: hypothetical protein ACE5HF_09800 [Gemmatimonadota bacterium]